MSSIKISQLTETPNVGVNDSLPIARGTQETFRTPAKQFVTQGSNIGSGAGQLFSNKSDGPTTLRFRTLSAVGENLTITTVGDTVVLDVSGQNPIKTTFVADGSSVAWPLIGFNSNNAANYRVDFDGVLQEPFTDYFLSGNQIVFTTPPLTSTKIVVVSNNFVKVNEAQPAPNTIQVEMFNSTFYNNSSKYLVLPTVSAVSALDTSAPKGSVSYTDDTNQIYYKNNTGWFPVTGRLGTITRPAPNAQAILDAGHSTGDGAYWIDSLTGPVLTYCDMTNGGYMLAAVLESSVSTLWAYSGALWTSITPYQENETAAYKIGTGGTTGGINAALNSLNRLFYEYTLTTGIRCCLGNKNNALAYAFTGNTAQSLFLTSPVNTRFTSFTRQAWLDWFQNGTGVNPSTVPGAPTNGFQPNCNQEGFNLNYLYVNGIRFGINFNEQNDCSSCDSAIGFGTNVSVSPGTNPAIQSGGYTHTPRNIYRANGYIFIK